MHRYIDTYVRTYVRTCITLHYIYIHIYIYIYTYIDIYIYSYSYIYIYIYIYIYKLTERIVVLLSAIFYSKKTSIQRDTFDGIVCHDINIDWYRKATMVANSV